MKYPPIENEREVIIKRGMSLRHIAERNDVPIQTLVALLPEGERTDFVTTFGNVHKPIQDHSLDKTDIHRAILGARTTGISLQDFIRFVLWAVWIVAAGLLLMLKKNTGGIRHVWLIATLVLFGIILGAAPNPMESIVKLHKLSRGVPGNPAVFVTLGFVAFTLLSLLGAKMLCSWGCQLGALQESLYNLPVFRGFKERHKFPFAASIAVRITVYLVFFLLFFGILNINQGGPGSILYHHFNLFKVFDPYELAPFTLLMIPALLLASLFVFRPFCHTICPFGLWAWLLENVALYKVVKVEAVECMDCGSCQDACPTGAMRAINEGNRRYFQPDCWSCGRCIEACPHEGLAFAPSGWGDWLPARAPLSKLPPLPRPDGD
jgi:NAD-dependent dihydropyrimidine dehydrogenase PreA subunit